MSPVLVLKDGRPVMTVGAPGGRKIINAVTQVVMNVVDFGMGMQDAIGAPRVDASGLDTLYGEAIAPGCCGGVKGSRSPDGGWAGRLCQSQLCPARWRAD